jgi:hypothetical protein
MARKRSAPADAPPLRLHPFGDDRVYELADDLDSPGGPVYRDPTGGVVVPSGRVLVRLREGESAEERLDELERSGFRLERVLPYAPHAAWVRSTAGTVGAALCGMERLRGMPGVEHVEPELIGESAKR